MNNPKQLKTGSDPRALPDYTALRNELSKLTHPARPDVNWRYAEKLCLSLFEHNGVELQTAAWYMLVRTQRAGLYGLNEGLSILEALITHQWGQFWPESEHARMEILSCLSKRLQQQMRTLPLSYGDLSQLYRAEQHLTNLGAVLERLALKHRGQFDTLRTLINSSAVRLENSEGKSTQPGIVPPVDISGIPITAKSVPVNTLKWVYVVQPEQQPNVEVMTEKPSPADRWKPFVVGMFTMLIAGSAAVWCWQYLHHPDPLRSQLDASMAPLPVALTQSQLQLFRQTTSVPKNVINDTQQQLARLKSLPADWPLDYAQQLVRQVQALLPEDAAIQQLSQAWQQQLNDTALPADAMNSWHQGMTKLQQLSERLNGLDEQRGKYMTVSELKSVVYSTTQAFNRSVPAEELLRRYAASSTDIQLRQVEIALEQLQKRYFLLRQEQGKAVTLPVKK